jgi:uridylate kinase
MAKGVVTFHAAGLGHPFFSTDTVTALRGLELEADCILYTKNGVGGVYDKAPDDFPDAKMYKSLPYSAAIASQLQFADLAALHLLAQGGVPALIFGLDEPDGIIRACLSTSTESTTANNGFGTWLHTTAKEEFYVNAHQSLRGQNEENRRGTRTGI